jgi:hypothetical protein
MSTTRDYLKELSDLFVSDLHASQYYRNLTPAERADVDQRLARDAAEGFLPLVPGALEVDLERLDEAIADRLGVEMPECVKALLREVDGFVENGTTLYSMDTELLAEDTGWRPGIAAENQKAWIEFPELSHRWLLVGDNELSFFAYDLVRGEFWALDRYSPLDKQHRFNDGDDLLRFLLRTALRIAGTEPAPKRLGEDG